MRNYQKELDSLLAKLKAKAEEAAPRLFLHSCCAPCSSYVLEYLSRYFEITVFYYNPNISPEEEYRKRVEEQKRFIGELMAAGGRKLRTSSDDTAFGGDGQTAPADGESALPDTGFYPVRFLEGDYDPSVFYGMAKGLEAVPEGGERCFKCYELRLREAARLAKEGGYDYFCTTLSISPMKNAEKLMEIGERLSEEYGVAYLPSNFKKKNGYKRSIELSREYGLYRQDYCGCVFSKQESERRRRGVSP